MNVSQGPEYGDASACLKITYSGDPARPVEHMFKMRAPLDTCEMRPKFPSRIRGASPAGGGAQYVLR